MPQVEESIIIEAPPAVVFDIIAHQPERMPEWWQPLELQQRVTPPPTRVGSVARYAYTMMGMKIKGEHQVLALEPDAHLVVKTISGIDAMFDFSLTPDEAGTRLTVIVAYSLPGSVLGHLLNRLTIEQKNERDFQEALQNLKALLEVEVAP